MSSRNFYVKMYHVLFTVTYRSTVRSHPLFVETYLTKERGPVSAAALYLLL